MFSWALENIFFMDDTIKTEKLDVTKDPWSNELIEEAVKNLTKAFLKLTIILPLMFICVSVIIYSTSGSAYISLSSFFVPFIIFGLSIVYYDKPIPLLSFLFNISVVFLLMADKDMGGLSLLFIFILLTFTTIFQFSLSTNCWSRNHCLKDSLSLDVLQEINEKINKHSDENVPSFLNKIHTMGRKVTTIECMEILNYFKELELDEAEDQLYEQKLIFKN